MNRVMEAGTARRTQQLASVVLMALLTASLISCASCKESDLGLMPSGSAAAATASPCCGHQDMDSCLHLPLVAQADRAAPASAPGHLSRTEVSQTAWRMPIVGLGCRKPEAAAIQGLQGEGCESPPLPVLRI